MARDDGRDKDAIAQFIEALGLYFEDAGVPRIAGRLLGLLLVTGHPLSLEEVATALRVSRASVSTNARLVLATGLAERVGLPGDRRDYYTFSSRGWEAVIQQGIKRVESLQQLASEALDALEPAETPARVRLQATVAFTEFYGADLAATVERWRTHAARRSFERRRRAAAEAGA